jgi:hypothetical protein
LFLDELREKGEIGEFGDIELAGNYIIQEDFTANLKELVE